MQDYVAGGGNGLKTEPHVGCKKADEARRKGEWLPRLRHVVVACAVSADIDLGDYDETPTIPLKSGRLPPPFDEV